MPVRVFMLARNAVFLKPRWNMDQQVQKVLWSSRLPKVFWFTSEKKYVWCQCGTPSHFRLVCRPTRSWARNGLLGKCRFWQIGCDKGRYHSFLPRINCRGSPTQALPVYGLTEFKRRGHCVLHSSHRRVRLHPTTRKSPRSVSKAPAPTPTRQEAAEDGSGLDYP